MKSDVRPLALVGPWLKNKGDDLMYRAVRDHFGREQLGVPTELWPLGLPDGSIKLLATPEPSSVRSALPDVRRAGRLLARRTLLSLSRATGTPVAARAPSEAVRGLIDCSGFAYGDAWKTHRMDARYGYYRTLKDRGVPLILLPQALGPFERPDMRDAARRLLGLFDLALARDAESLRHLEGLDLPGSVRTGLVPDVSHLVAGEAPGDAEAWSRRVAIVPNAKMLDGSMETDDSYLGLIVDLAQVVRAEGHEPWLVLHEANDAALAQRINDRLAAPLPVADVDPVQTKGILGCCRLVIGSRFHALVSALSQATPCLATSWSHKYRALLGDYGHADHIIAPDDPDDARARVRSLLADGPRARVVARLERHAAEHKGEVVRMWKLVDAMLAGSPEVSRRSDLLAVAPSSPP